MRLAAPEIEHAAPHPSGLEKIVHGEHDESPGSCSGWGLGAAVPSRLQGKPRELRLLPRERLLVIPLDFLIHFLAMHRQIGGRLDTQLHDLTVNPYDFDPDASVDHDALTRFARKDEHKPAGGESSDDGFSHRQRVVDRILRRIGHYNLLAHHRVTINNDRPFEVHGRPPGSMQGHDVQQNRIFGFLKTKELDVRRR